MENIYNDPIISIFWDKVTNWMAFLQQNPYWRKFNKEKISYTLIYDEHVNEDGIHEFEFDEQTKKEHEFLMCYVELISCLNALVECEYYFRRYPFNGLPVRHADYLTRNCEVFFNKIYEFRERIKNLGAAYKAVSPNHYMDTGRLIKHYDNSFSYELKERNLLNHHSRFSDIALNKLGIIKILEEEDTKLAFLESSNVEYRRICRLWVKKVQTRSEVVKKYLVAITEHLTRYCGFLNAVK
ncbi:hypothetical protein [Mucilaginibacter ginkgonis]|uniref:Cthe-2314-like HEPN domain-containing protein n=1 Tax=Mucilaginibacter ginkgonis TaxID=2682091 RepID=A0A6I4I136_9SPHI|nr:hypothetical protein [Mucilaginibacter ginkgonis]QQL51211.1 hypothetical protein GO620_007115 [Mucilaginibacter ginkgonis]